MPRRAQEPGLSGSWRGHQGGQHVCEAHARARWQDRALIAQPPAAVSAAQRGWDNWGLDCRVACRWREAVRQLDAGTREQAVAALELAREFIAPDAHPA